MSVVLCANRLQDRTEMEEALVHELVHVYDVRGWRWTDWTGAVGGVTTCYVRLLRHTRAHRSPPAPQHALVKMDLTNCDELAYSEVRAAREAECHYSPQLCSWFKKQCAKSTATRSTSVRCALPCRQRGPTLPAGSLT